MRKWRHLRQYYVEMKRNSWWLLILFSWYTKHNLNISYNYMHWRNIIILYYWYNTCILFIECMPCTCKKERDCIGIVCCSIPFICSCEYNMLKTNKTEIVCMPDIHVVCCVRSYTTWCILLTINVYFCSTNTKYYPSIMHGPSEGETGYNNNTLFRCCESQPIKRDIRWLCVTNTDLLTLSNNTVFFLHVPLIKIASEVQYGKNIFILLFNNAIYSWPP